MKNDIPRHTFADTLHWYWLRLRQNVSKLLRKKKAEEPLHVEFTQEFLDEHHAELIKGLRTSRRLVFSTAYLMCWMFGWTIVDLFWGQYIVAALNGAMFIFECFQLPRILKSYGKWCELHLEFHLIVENLITGIRGGYNE